LLWAWFSDEKLIVFSKNEMQPWRSRNQTDLAIICEKAKQLSVQCEFTSFTALLACAF
jgi:hypothetical protein